ncbi:MAG: hypothetical protein ACI86H_000647 [bacterium]|jgi:hypothetical protein
MEIDTQISQLKKTHPNLAKVFQDNWDTPLSKFSKKLFQISSKKMIEPTLFQAFEEEWASMNIPQSTILKFIDQIKTTPVLQTSHHITPTNGPTFFTLDAIALSGIPKDQTLLVAANSGVAFSNTAWSGSLSYQESTLEELFKIESKAYQQAKRSAKERQSHGDQEKKISLIPSKKRDDLLFGNQIEEQQSQLFQQFSESLQKTLVEPKLGESYTHWASNTCSQLQKKIFQQNNIFYFDINQVINRYLIKMLKEGNQEHPVYQILFGSQSQQLLENFENPTIFLGRRKGKKSWKVQPILWNNQEFTEESLIQALEEQSVCPSVFLLFFILRFLNGIHCLGSFNQIEYLENYRKAWQSLNFPWNLDLTPDGSQTLTTGRMLWKDELIYPLDWAFQNKTFALEEIANIPMKYFWQRTLKQLRNG